MKSKYFFEDKKELIDKEHKLYKTYQENHPVSLGYEKCDHKGKVRIENGLLKCKCGASWGGPEIETLYKLLNK